MFQHNSHVLRTSKIENERLRIKCMEDPDLEWITRRHRLCEFAEEGADSSVWLMAVQQTLTQLKLCGSYSCEEILLSWWERTQLNFYSVIFLLFFLVVLSTGLIMPLVKELERRVLSRRALTDRTECQEIVSGCGPGLNSYGYGQQGFQQYMSPRIANDRVSPHMRLLPSSDRCDYGDEGATSQQHPTYLRNVVLNGAGNVRQRVGFDTVGV